VLTSSTLIAILHVDDDNMEGVMKVLLAAIQRLWRASRPLTAVGLGMLVVFVLTLAGLVVDPRVIGGAPAWLKPAKFAISTAIYAMAFAWIFTYLAAWPRLTRTVGAVTAAVMVIEVALISMQAARGTTSHFNIGTPFDAVTFGVMGAAIVVAWAASIALAVALFRQPFADRALGWALRFGLVITVIGSATGGLMTQPTGAQMAAARATHRMPVSGAHTVGAADGGPGLPGTGWSREHGDLRVPHFLGLHAVQILPLMAFLLRRSVLSAARRQRAVFVAAASYASLFGILLGQALSGQSVLAPEGLTLAAIAAWLAGTLAGAAWVRLSSGNGANVPSMNVAVSR
jgi:hypothetical protein